ncbi:T9SS type A sorting domain-containing protein [Hymenobacter latericus]|uniref:T9SS type A sorting domain-containing protein n=1 Tax=Hymenobacter sp. YIM 151858-1 TaxID=2987688 RepID=UPI002226C9CF|nr:T9SS type A sorting domain-containing protein [Hymenobacter sp. YIM 151858-1]UYZ57581.1 T9SS type A sorting domain-containing protein [Hymenobacter sp. YIM 151858-1]
MKTTLAFAAAAVLAAATACDPGIAFEPVPFGHVPPRQRLSLEQLLGGPAVVLVGPRDTLRLRVRYEPATQLNLITSAASGDTLLHGWAYRYKRLFYLVQARPGGAYWVHAARIKANKVTGLISDYEQLAPLARAVRSGAFGQLVSARNPKGEPTRLRFEAKTLRPFYEAVLDSCTTYRLGGRPGPGPQAPATESLIASVYPNPAAGQTTIVLADTGTYHLEVVDAQGRTRLALPAARGAATLELGSLPAGTYWVRAHHAKRGRTATKLLVGQRP